MRTGLKVLAIFAGIVFSFILIFSLMVVLADPNNYKNYFVLKFEEVIGQKLIVNGPISLSFFPVPHLKLDDAKIIIQVKETDIEVSAKKLSFYIPWKSIFSDIKTINSVDGKDINIQYLEKSKVLETFHVDSLSGDVDISYLHIDLSNVEIISTKNKIKGKLLFFLENNVELSGSFQSKEINIPVSSDNVKQSFSGFLSKLYQLKWLKNVGGHVDFNFDKINFEDTLVEDSHFIIDLKDSIFNITAQGKAVKGDYIGKIIIQKNEKANMPEVTTDFKINNHATFKTVEGKLTFAFENKLPAVKGKLKFKQWDASFFLDEKDFFSSSYQDLQGNLNLQVDTLTLQKINIENANIDIEKKDSKITIHMKGNLAKGLITNHITIKQQEKNTNNKVQMNLKLSHVSGSEMIKLFHSNMQIEGGILDLSFQGESIGNNANTFIANLSGKSNLYLQSMKLLNQNFDMRHVDVFAAIFKNLQSGKKETIVECIAWHFDVDHGIAKANNSIALETREIYVLGTGTLDLQTKKLDFAFDLHPRSQMNLEIGSMDNIVFLKGTLDEPQLKNSTQGIVREGGSLVLGIATGGISLLAEKLLKIANHRRSPCKEVLVQ